MILCYLWLELIESQIGGAITHMLEFLHSSKKINGKYFIITSKSYVYLENEPHISLNYDSKPKLLLNVNFNPIVINKLSYILQEKNIDLIYQRHIGFTDLGAKLGKQLDLPFFLEFNGPVGWITKQWARGWRRHVGRILLPILNHYEQKSLKGATKIFVVSRPMKDIVVSLGIPEEKIVINPNGVDPEKFHPGISGAEVRKKYNIPESAIVVGFISTFGRWHGADILARAAREIVKGNKDVYFLFMGDGFYRNQAEEIAGKNERIIFTGTVPREQVPKHLASCDILVNPTVPNPDGTEFFGSPTKLFEYMAMGKAIVSSALGQMKEILEHEKDALLVEGGNYKALKEAILTLAEDKNLRKKLGKNARKKVIKEYTWKRNAERVLKAYEEL